MLPRKVYVSAKLPEQVVPLLLAEPELSDRAVATEAGCAYSSAVPAIRRELEAAGQIPVLRRRGRGEPVLLFPAH
ncbi:MAG TPA: hypothetical protein VLM11_13940 [Streptosporangiaceae bacterium]|nr:hypothetical protein [Streptosporangiaceae bacterium]